MSLSPGRAETRCDIEVQSKQRCSCNEILQNVIVSPLTFHYLPSSYSKATRLAASGESNNCLQAALLKGCTVSWCLNHSEEVDIPGLSSGVRDCAGSIGAAFASCVALNDRQSAGVLGPLRWLVPVVISRGLMAGWPDTRQALQRWHIRCSPALPVLHSDIPWMTV